MNINTQLFLSYIKNAIRFLNGFFIAHICEAASVVA